MNQLIKWLSRLALLFSILGLAAVIADFGYNQNSFYQEILGEFYFLVLGFSLVSTSARYFSRLNYQQRGVIIFDIVSMGFTLWVFYLYLFVGVPFERDLLLENPVWVQLAIFMAFIREGSELKLNFKRAILNPAQLFVTSFILIILFGTFLLMTPRATFEGLSFIDALFTATSAVCVTGLIVVDTGSYFTDFGQVIILFLIQIGGLGILTFASYFSYFFKGGSSFENQFALSDMTNSKKIGEVFSTLKAIIYITFGIEFFSACLIYLSLDGSLFPNLSRKVFFAIFHSISAFCNAGFSTLPNGLYESGFRFNYSLQLIIIITFVLGGLGFPIVNNLIGFLRYKIKTLFFTERRRLSFRPWIVNINSRITLVTTLLISTVGFLLFYVLEYNNTLAEHAGFGKVVTALFGATTPRTAGFNTIDSSQMLFPTTMVIFLLMWIGASPASTGGGIKTSTFAIATLNILSLARGKNKIEVYRREISDISVRRAFATISLSLIVIGVGICLLSIYNPELGLLQIGFEAFSAFSTVGLSLGITSSLSEASKIVLTLMMFVGRVSMLSLLIAVFKKVRYKNYQYPPEEIVIN